MQVRAKVTNIRVSPRKARLVVDAVRGKRVMDAIAIAKFLPQRTPRMSRSSCGRCGERGEQLRSRPGGSLDQGDLRRRGPSFRRFKAKARGRVGRITRQNTHITVIAEDREG
jgi:large subunit ribosomal protein L22